MNRLNPYIFTHCLAAPKIRYVCFVSYQTARFIIILMLLALLPLSAWAANNPPVANAGGDKSIYPVEIGWLKGSATDPDGDSIKAWQWSIVSVPAGSDPSRYGFNDASLPDPYFYPDAPGLYQLQLIVNDGQDESEPDYINVLVLGQVYPCIGTFPIDFSFAARVGEPVVIDLKGNDGVADRCGALPYVDVEVIGLPQGAVAQKQPADCPWDCSLRIIWTPDEDDIGIHSFTAVSKSSCEDDYPNYYAETSQTVRVAVGQLKINSIEFTQAIQQWQTFEEMKTYLELNDGVLPVPLIGGKPGAARVYADQVPEQIRSTVEVWVQEDYSAFGYPIETPEMDARKSVVLSPFCTPEDRRKEKNVPIPKESGGGSATCRSVNYYGTPGEKFLATFNEMDTFIDNRVSFSEFSIYFPDATQGEFNVFDVDGDGFISDLEWKRAGELVKVNIWFFIKYDDPERLPNLRATQPQDDIRDLLIDQLCLLSNPIPDDFRCALMLDFPNYFVNIGDPDEHKLTLKVKAAEPLVLKEVRVSHSLDPVTNKPIYPPPAELARHISFLKKVAPTHEVRADYTGLLVFNPYPEGSLLPWWRGTAQKIFNYWKIYGNKSPSEEYWYFYGIVPLIAGADGLTHSADPDSSFTGCYEFLPAALSKTSVNSVNWGDRTAAVVAHETGHMLGLRHTNALVVMPGSQPGCWAQAPDDCTDWVYPDNRIQSGPQNNPKLEVGFDVEERMALDPETTYELMSYCSPQWISPRSYNLMFDALTPPLMTTSQQTTSFSQISFTSMNVQGEYWVISGTIAGSGVVFEPLFKREALGSTQPGTGSHRIEVKDSDGLILFTRYFYPIVGSVDISDENEQVDETPFFVELVPVQSGAAQVAVMDNNNQEIGQILLAGSAPVISIVFPAGGETLNGPATLLWTVNDPDSADHTYWVEYSSDGGSTWKSLGSGLTQPNAVVDFDEQPGSSGQSIIRVFASDGANTGTATSNLFTVLKKPPQAQILSPAENSEFKIGNPVRLQALANDPDDGPIQYGAIRWVSDLDGTLGYGNDLTVSTLSEGKHTLSLYVTDTDSNQVSDDVAVFVKIEKASEVSFCEGDFETDGDLDGKDVFLFVSDPKGIGLGVLASNFGRTNCP